ncbi:MAG: hypothetical protein JWO06_3799 [Bacteroidota bacterium]|nr:hypothetical protein [Bacteroidota bacterium]
MKYFLLLLFLLNRINSHAQFELLKGNWESKKTGYSLWIISPNNIREYNGSLKDEDLRLTDLFNRQNYPAVNTINDNGGRDQFCFLHQVHDTLKIRYGAFKETELYFKILSLNDSLLQVQLLNVGSNTKLKTGQKITFEKTEREFKSPLNFEKLSFTCSGFSIGLNLEFEINASGKVRCIKYPVQAYHGNPRVSHIEEIVPQFYEGHLDSITYLQLMALIERAKLPSLHFGNLWVGNMFIRFDYNGRRRLINSSITGVPGPDARDMTEFLQALPAKAELHTVNNKFKIFKEARKSLVSVAID